MQSEIDIKRFKKLQRISKGSFGVVYEIEEKKTGEIYAAKVIDCDDNKEKCNEMINRELDILIHSKHPTIIKFIGYSRIDFHEESNVTIIMEFVKNGSLRDVLQKIQQNYGPKNYTNTSRQIILVGISRGMKYLHDRNIIHRDIKPENILLDENFQPHITDFGLSKYYDMGHSHSQTMYGGTLSYKAPEILRKLKYNGKVDVYSFAILMYEVLTDSVPYPEIGQISEYDFMRKVINNDYRPKFNFPIKDSLRILIEKCWSNNPDERPSFDEIFNKLSNSEDNEYLLDDVDIDELNMYVEDIMQVTDCTEHLLKKISDLELDNKKLQIEVNNLKSENKSHLDENKALKLDNKKLQIEINKLKSENKSHLDANKALEFENEQLRKEIYKIKSENEKHSDANKDIKKEESKIMPKSDETKQSGMKFKQPKNDYDQTNSPSFTVYNEKCIWEKLPKWHYKCFEQKVLYKCNC